MTPLNYLDSAVADLEGIFVNIYLENDLAAERTVARIRKAVERLEIFPRSSPEHPEIGPGVRGFTVGNYFILYRVEQDRVDIVRVVHAAREMRGLLDE